MDINVTRAVLCVVVDFVMRHCEDSLILEMTCGLHLMANGYLLEMNKLINYAHWLITCYTPGQ
jgi:hypothetical protein